MAVKFDDFICRFPEFQSAPESLVRAALKEAARHVDECVFGTQTDDAIYWKAAHILAIKPFGRNARLVNKDGSTTYGEHFMKLAKSVTAGFRVA